MENISCTFQCLFCAYETFIHEAPAVIVNNFCACYSKMTNVFFQWNERNCFEITCFVSKTSHLMLMHPLYSRLQV